MIINLMVDRLGFGSNEDTTTIATQFTGLAGRFSELLKGTFVTIRNIDDPRDYAVYKVQHPDDTESVNPGGLSR